MKKINIFSFLLIMLLITANGLAQVTTSGMNGRVTGNNTETLPGANVVAVHLPTGSSYGTVTDVSGLYRIPNMAVGGPYKITVSFVGYETFVREDIYLNLGQTFRLNVNLAEKASQITGVEVITYRNEVFDGNRTGSETNLGLQDIERMPTIARNISDFTRLTPQARVTQFGGIEVAGTNNRYNAIYIDGAVNNDVFGLADAGTNGGQTGISPFSVDIIEQFSISIAPYDVKLGGFAGAGINAVTRRGTNEIQGSAYFYNRNEGLAGKTPTDDEDLQRVRYNDFTAKTYGFRIGGPVIKDKLFVFVNAEFQKDETPQPFEFSTYAGSVTAAQLSELSDKVKGMGYDPGSYEGGIRSLEGTKLFARLDYNFNNVHKLMVRHQYTKGIQTSPSTPSPTNLRFSNSGIYTPSITNTTAIELKSNFSNRMSNSLMIGLTYVRDDRDPMGENFPYVRIKDGSANIYLGSEEFSTANQLNQNIITLTDHLEFYRGKHTISVGTHNEFYKMYNLFIRQNFGSYQFNNINDFLTGAPAYQFDRTFSVLDDVTGDGSKAAAEFSAMQLGLYVQDEYQVNDKLKITAGLRLDMPMFSDNPPLNVDFNDNVVPILIENGWDVMDAKTGHMPDAVVMLNPRFGFNYDVKGDKTMQIRGGAGLFTSRIPFVWPGASFQNNGVTTGGMRVTTTSGDSTLLVFNPAWDNQPVLPPAQPSGQVDIFAKDFKFPKVFRANIAVDKKLVWGLIATLDFTYTKNINNVAYYNLAYKKTGELTGSGDNRPIWSKIDLGNDLVTGKKRAYTDIILGYNTNEGYAYNFTAQLQKAFSSNFSSSIAYTFGKATSLNDGVSSQNSSQWRVPNVRGKNDLDVGISNFDMGHRIVGYVTYKMEYLNNITISLFYTGQSGERFSYGYADGSSTFLGEDNQSLELIYVPKDQNDINLIDLKDNTGAVTLSKEQQWADLNAFIENDKYLKDRRGDYVERNHSRVPFVHIFDFRIAQDFYIMAGGKRNTLQLSFDVFNFGNMLNKDWGRLYYASGAYYSNYPLIKFEGFEADKTTPKFSFTKPKGDVWAIDDSGLLSSRWQAQIGIRYTFN